MGCDPRSLRSTPRHAPRPTRRDKPPILEFVQRFPSDTWEVMCDQAEAAAREAVRSEWEFTEDLADEAADTFSTHAAGWRAARGWLNRDADPALLARNSPIRAGLGGARRGDSASTSATRVSLFLDDRSLMGLTSQSMDATRSSTNSNGCSCPPNRTTTHFRWLCDPHFAKRPPMYNSGVP